MITVVLPAPVSANVYWRTRVVKGVAMTYVSSEAKAFKAETAYRCKQAGIRRPLQGRIEVEIAMYPQRPKDWEKRVRTLGALWDDGVRSLDLDNAIKVTLDSLSGVVFDDDKQVHRIIAQRMEPDGDARLVVIVRPIAAKGLQQELIP